jgi:ferredoxin
MAGAILQGLGIAEDNIRIADGLAEIDAPGKAARETTALDIPAGHSPGAPLTLFAGHDKRSLVRLAVQHLYDCSGVREPCIPLPPGSPFGSVAVDSSLCTLCMACAVACPTGALSAGGDVPRLAFLESRCHQCRLCEVTCPEGAIHLSPRILCDPAAVETPASLREVEPFRCIECGIPFASQVMINRMREKLTGHWMYAGERQLRRLQMCRTCRTRDALSSQEMKSWIA